MVAEDALGVPIGVEIDTANDGVLPLSVVVLGTRVVEAQLMVQLVL